MDINDVELKIAKLLSMLAPDFLPVNESVVLADIPDDVLDRLYSKNVKFSDKVNSVKAYIKQPNRSGMVKVMPTHETEVVKFSREVQSLVELFYMLRCIAAVLPEHKKFCDDIINSVEYSTASELTWEQITQMHGLIRTMRGTSSAVSAVAAAALKIFYTVDGMAFDEFSLSLTALEWEEITKNMNEIRLNFAERIRRLSSEKYQMTTAKAQKIVDKADLDKEIDTARIALVKIMKLTPEDLHRVTQAKIISNVNIKDGSKKIRYDRRDAMAQVKAKVLAYYREHERLDILKYVKENPIDF
jgi:hypothetical protein